MDNLRLITSAFNLMENFKNCIEDDVNKEEEELWDDLVCDDSHEDLLFGCISILEEENEGRHIIRIQNYMECVVANYNETQFQQNFRLTRSAFEKTLADIVVHYQQDKFGRKQIPLEKQLMAVLWLLATPDSYRSVCERFDMPKSTLSMCFVRIINLLNKTVSQNIKWPSGEDLRIVKTKFALKSPFTNLVGVIDGTYVKVKAPKDQARAYTNRKCYTSMTLQAICDADMRFTHCYTGWPSSVPDIRVFKNSDIYQRCLTRKEDFFPNGEYILGDKAYTPLTWCIPPYMKRRVLSGAEQNFNRMHASTRAVIERSFALFFGRFRRMRDLDMNRIDWVPATILSCCVLHNICLNFNEPSREQFIEEGMEIVCANSFEQDSQDIERPSQDGISMRNAICRQIQ